MILCCGWTNHCVGDREKIVKKVVSNHLIFYFSSHRLLTSPRPKSPVRDQPGQAINPQEEWGSPCRWTLDGPGNTSTPKLSTTSTRSSIPPLVSASSSPTPSLSSDSGMPDRISTPRGVQPHDAGPGLAGILTIHLASLRLSLKSHGPPPHPLFQLAITVKLGPVSWI